MHLKACDRLTLLSTLRSVDLNNKEANPYISGNHNGRTSGELPMLQDCEDSKSLTSGRDYSYQQFCQDLIDKLDYSQRFCEEPKFGTRGDS